MVDKDGVRNQTPEGENAGDDTVFPMIKPPLQKKIDSSVHAMSLKKYQWLWSSIEVRHMMRPSS